MTTRETDARNYIPQEQQFIGYRDLWSGKVYTPEDPSFNEVASFVESEKHPPRLTPEEEQKYSDYLREQLEASEVNYPHLARFMLEKPEYLWLGAEIGLGLYSQDQQIGDLIAVAHDSMEAVMAGLDSPVLLEDYQQWSEDDGLQQMFWSEIAGFYDTEERNAFLGLFAAVSEKSAGRMASRALAWAEGKDLRNPADRAALWVYLHQEALNQQEWEKGTTGFAGVLDWLENRKDDLMEGTITTFASWFGDPTDAVRRSGLTVGEQVAYQMGLRPGDENVMHVPIMGEVGSWNVVSGLLDGVSEIILDPLNILAGIGIGMKAVKTTEFGVTARKAAEAGRVRAAARAWFAPTRRFSKSARNIKGGRTARAFYMLRGKTVEQMLDSQRVRKVLEDVHTLLKNGDRAKFAVRYPGLAKLPGEALDIMADVDKNVDDVVETLKAVMMNDLNASSEALELADLERVTRYAEIGVRVDARNSKFTDDEMQAFIKGENALAQHSKQQRGMKKALGELLSGKEPKHYKAQAHALFKGWRNKAKEYPGLNRWLSQDQVDEVLEKGTGGRLDLLFESVAGEGEEFAAKNKKLRAFFSDDTKALFNQAPKDPSGELFVAGRFKIGKIDEKAKTVELIWVEDIIPAGTPKPDISVLKLLNDGVDPGSVREALLAEARYQQLLSRGKRFYLIADDIQAPRRIFSRRKWLGAFKNRSARTRAIAARLVPGAPRGHVALFDPKKGAQDLHDLFTHFGISEERMWPVIQKFIDAAPGARQDVLFEEVLPFIGEELGVGALKYNLISLYRSGKLRRFSSMNADLWEELGKWHRGPVFAYQFGDEAPIPLEAMDQILKRNRQAGKRGLKLRQGGNLSGKDKRRQQIAARFKAKLAQDGVTVTDEEAWQIGFSTLSDPGDVARGWGSARAMMQAAGTAWEKQHNFFKLSMLMGRPWAWSARVLMEEHLRAFVSNLPSLTRNPVESIMGMFRAHVLARMGQHTDTVSRAADEYIKLVNSGDTVEKIADNLLDLAPRVFEDGLPTNVAEARRLVRRFFETAVRDRASLGQIDAIKRVPRNVRKATRRLEQADRYLDKMGLTPQQLEDAYEAIQMQQVFRGFYKDIPRVFDNEPSIWVQGMGKEAAHLHGQRHAFLLDKASRDTFGRMAMLRLMDEFSGWSPRTGRTAQSLVEHPRWQLIRSDLVRRFPNDALDDLVLAERYFDEVVGPEVKHILEPFLENLNDVEKADLIENLVMNHKVQTSVGGMPVDLNFSQLGKAAHELGDLTADTVDTVKWVDLAPVPFDPRFVQQDANWVHRGLAFFGDELSQKINRRPAFEASLSRWKHQLTEIGMDDYNATKIATEKAIQEVNAVFFDPELAPYYVKKLEGAIPFFKATYEVMSQWTYKMPVAMGGYWPMGIGEFGRKLDRFMQALVETGVGSMEVDADGNRNFNLQVGDWQVSLGDPLDPTSFGLLSFFQFSVGLNPVGASALTAVKSGIPGASAGRQTTSTGETWAQLADRLNVDPIELAEQNRHLFYEGDAALGDMNYLGILGNVPGAMDVAVPEGMAVRIPQSALGEALEELFLPMGDTDWKTMPLQYMPAAIRNWFVGMGLAQTPADEFFQDGEIASFDGLIPIQSRSSVMTQASEHMMYMEAHPQPGMPTIKQMMDKELEIVKAKEREDADLVLKLQHDLDQMQETYFEELKKATVGGLILKGFLGQTVPATPYKQREEALEINSYWASREYAESLKAGVGEVEVLPFESAEQIDEFYELVAQWLYDDTGEGAKALFARQHPELLAYLTPKTFYGAEGMPPEGGSFDRYTEQIISGQRETNSPIITALRYYGSQIAVDSLNDYIVRFGSDPTQAAANALWDRESYDEWAQTRSDRYTVRKAFDDLHGSPYDDYLRRRLDPEAELIEDMIDKRYRIKNALDTLEELAQNGDPAINAVQLQEDAAAFRNARRMLSESIAALQDQEELEGWRNPFEKAYNKYFTDIYQPYTDEESALYDQVQDVWDDERAQLIYEQIRMFHNAHAFDLNEIDGVLYPNPYEFRWLGKTDEEREINRQKWVTRPLEWMDLIQAGHLVDAYPEIAPYIPTTTTDARIYNQYTLSLIAAHEAYEANEIGQGDWQAWIATAKERLRTYLTAEGRVGEAAFLDMTPYDKMRVAGVLPELLDTRNIREAHAFYKEELAAQDVSADSDKGRRIVEDFIYWLRSRADADTAFRTVLQDIGRNIAFPSSTYTDDILPWLFFGAKER